MTTKKTTRGARAQQPAPAHVLLRRADTIIPDALKYDVETRLELQRIATNIRDFKGRPADVDELRRALARVERGESLADLSGIDAGAVEAARAFLSLIKEPHVMHLPDGIFSGMIALLDITAEKSRARLWRETEEGNAETGEYSLQILARVFNGHDSALKFEIEEKHDLADHIAAVMSDEDTPAKLYNAMADELADLESSRSVRDEADVIRAALRKHSEKEEEE